MVTLFDPSCVSVCLIPLLKSPKEDFIPWSVLLFLPKRVDFMIDRFILSLSYRSSFLGRKSFVLETFLDFVSRVVFRSIHGSLGVFVFSPSLESSPHRFSGYMVR